MGVMGKRFRDEDIQNLLDDTVDERNQKTTTCDIYKTLVNNGRNYLSTGESRISSIDSIFHLGFG